MTTIPIDPSAREEERRQYLLTMEPSKDLLTATNGLYCPAEFFVVLRQICEAVSKGTQWNKRARIVIEYDPGQPKMSVNTFIESDELKDKEGCDDHGRGPRRESKDCPVTDPGLRPEQSRIPHPEGDAANTDRKP